MRKLSAHEGVLAGLYRGQAVTLLREAQAYGVWFLVFEYLMNADAKRNQLDRGPSFVILELFFFLFSLRVKCG